MWIFTVDGYFSAVQDKDDPSRIMVRSRQKGDLQTFLKRLESEDLEILAWVGSDYAFRVFMPRDLWMKYLEMAGRELTYTNFKARAILMGDHSRSDAYYRIWRVLKEWQDKDSPPD
jgi:hypothetical protein